MTKAAREAAKRVAQINAINAFAELEGWAIFNECEIQRIDCPDVGDPKFDSDEDALYHVQRLALHRSALHRMALSMIVNENRENFPVIVRRFSGRSGKGYVYLADLRLPQRTIGDIRKVGKDGTIRLFNERRAIQVVP